MWASPPAIFVVNWNRGVVARKISESTSVPDASSVNGYSSAAASLHIEIAIQLALVFLRIERRDVEAVTDLLEIEIGDVSLCRVLRRAVADAE